MKLLINDIENGVFELVRLKLVELGYYPDILVSNTEALWNAAIEAIKTSGKKVIYPYNVGSYKGREKLRENSIVLDLEEMVPSRSGTMRMAQREYNEDNDNYDKNYTPKSWYDLQYRLTMICYDAEYLNVMQLLLIELFNVRRKINAIDNSGAISGDFWSFYSSYINTDSAKFIERSILFNITNVNLIGDDEVDPVPRMKELTFEIKIDPSEGIIE